MISTTTHNKDFANGIKCLTIISRGPSHPISKIRIFLSHAKYIQTLELDLPRISATTCARMFRGLHFEQLECLSTTIPHGALVETLWKHPRLCCVVMGHCGATKECPIRDVPFTALSEIAGPVSCVSNLIHNNPVTSTKATYYAVRDFQLPRPRLFTSLNSSSAIIQILHLDFLPQDHTILRSIAAAVPFLSALKLTEKSPEHVVSLLFMFPPEPVSFFSPWQLHVPPRRAWSNRRQWVQDLRSFHRLKRFLLCTTVSLVPTPRDNAAEMDLIVGWLQDEENPWKASRYHPSLDHITLWYSYGRERSYLSWWNRDGGKGGKWWRLGSVVNPDHSQFV
jgi:hypothetical protein